MNTNQKTTPNKPIAKFKAGAVIATVWANPAQGATGEIIYNSISLDRRYQDKNGAWQSTSSLRVNDLPRAALVLQKAYEHLVMKAMNDETATTATSHVNASIGATTIAEEDVLVA